MHNNKLRLSIITFLSRVYHPCNRNLILFGYEAMLPWSLLSIAKLPLLASFIQLSYAYDFVMDFFFVLSWYTCFAKCMLGSRNCITYITKDYTGYAIYV